MKRIFFILMALVLIGDIAIESQNVRRTGNAQWVVAQGWGKRESDAKMDAMKNGLETVIYDILTNVEEIKKFKSKREMFLSMPSNYVLEYKIKGKIKQSGTRRGKRFKYTMTFNLLMNMGRLREDLAALGIMLSSERLHTELHKFKIMPVVDKERSSPEFYEKRAFVYSKIGSYLQDHGIKFIGVDKIKDIEANEEIVALDKSSSAHRGEEDILLQLARNTHADFYIKVEGHITETDTEGIRGFKTSVAVTVFEVMTADNIASQTGYSPSFSLSTTETSVLAGIENAISAAMNDIINKMRRFWNKYVQNGRPYCIMFYDYPFEEFAAIRRTLGSMVSDMKLDKQAGNLRSYTVWYKGRLENLMDELPGRVPMNLKGNKDPKIIGNTLRFFRETE